VTVAVLSGLAFSEYIFIGIVIFLGMSAAKSFTDNLDSPINKSLDPIIPQARIGTTTTNNNNNINNPQNLAGKDGPYNAYNYSPPPSAKTAPSQQSYDDLNPQYGYHLQQLSLQQQHQQQQQQQPKPPTAPSVYYQPVREAPAVPSSANNNVPPMNRGRLQVLHNQRQRPAPPPVPAKPSANNSNLYRY
jgi:hypothetical protein